MSFCFVLRMVAATHRKEGIKSFASRVCVAQMLMTSMRVAASGLREAKAAIDADGDDNDEE